MILVTGATGKSGREIVTQLSQAGAKWPAKSRRPSPRSRVSTRSSSEDRRSDK